MTFKNGRDRRIYKITMLPDSTYYLTVCTIGLILVLINMSSKTKAYSMVISPDFHQVTPVNCTREYFRIYHSHCPWKKYHIQPLQRSICTWLRVSTIIGHPSLKGPFKEPTNIGCPSPKGPFKNSINISCPSPKGTFRNPQTLAAPLLKG